MPFLHQKTNEMPFIMKSLTIRRSIAVLVLAGAWTTLEVRSAELFREPWRPQFHFTPQTNWMNDPNGMVFYDGEYHLFHQYNPFGDKWGHMSWGHAVSRDLVHWERLPVALYEENDIMIFSGSAVVDWNNTSGFGQNGKPPLVAIYTGHYTKKRLQNQQLAYSNDRGRTWTKYSGNPVLDIGEADFRDPKVFWHEPAQRWIMSVAWPLERKIRFYASPNLKDWTHLSDFGPAGSTKGIWECPDLFPLPVENKNGQQKWTLIVSVGSGAPAGGSGCQYFIGEFDGAHFTLDPSFPKPAPEFVPSGGKLLADFEGDDYGDWLATGTAFGSGPARGRIGDQQPVDGFRGRGLVNTFLDGDRSEGTLTSPEFVVTHDYLSFLIGGGNHPGKTCMNLLVDGRVVRTATGDNAERLSWKSWDAREFQGKQARLEIVDRHTGGWGHINIDHILLADEPARPPTEPALWADWGRDFYAAVSWSDIPKSDGRRLWIGWMSNWEYANDVPTSPWRSAMSIPRELRLRHTPEGFRLVQHPVRELAKIRGKGHRLGKTTLAAANAWLAQLDIASDLLEIALEWDSVPATGEAGLRIRTGPDEATIIRYEKGRLSLDRTRSGRVDFHPAFSGIHEAPVRLSDGRLRLHLFLDTSSLEVFAANGETVLTDLILPASGGRQLELIAGSNSTELRLSSLEVWELRPQRR
jgi:sucrose-6-phosphate hydrolase SacC (GH32 family)